MTAPSASVSTTRARVNGIELRLHRHEPAAPDGAASGLTVLLLHGFMDAGATWDLVATRLAAAGHAVVAPDLRGFGASERAPPGSYYHFPDYVADVDALVEHLAATRLAIVGHSMGGTVASLYAGARPERVERLAVLEGLGTLGAEPDAAVDRMQTWLRQLRELDRSPRPLASLDEAVMRLARNHPRVPDAVLRTRAPLLTRIDAAGQLVWAYDPLHRTRSPAPFQPDIFAAFLRRIRCPTLFVTGGAHGWHPPDENERVACIAGARSLEIPDAGHMLHWTTPGPLADALASFFAS